MQMAQNSKTNVEKRVEEKKLKNNRYSKMYK